MAEQWLSIVEYARQFNISDMTVRRRIKTGRLQAVLREGKYYIPIEDSPQATTPRSNPAVQTKTQPVFSRPAEASHLEYPQQQQLKVTAPPSKQPTYIPSHLSNQTRGPQPSQSDISAVLAYCERSLDRLAQVETHLASKHEAEIGRLKAELNARNLEIKNLSQQIEDLQVLVKLLEKKTKS